MNRTVFLLVLSLLAVTTLVGQEASLPTRLTPDELVTYEELSLNGNVSPLRLFGMAGESELFETAGYTEIAEYLRHRERSLRTRFGISMFFVAGGFTAMFVPAIGTSGSPFAFDTPIGLTTLIAGAVVTTVSAFSFVGIQPYYPEDTRTAVADEYNRWLIREIRAGRL